MRFRNLKKQSKHYKENKKDSVVYAYYPDRIKALITDLFMIYAPILYVITYVVMDGKDSFQSSQLAHLAGVVIYGIIYAILLAKLGQTPGKKAYDIKVVDAKTGKNISFLRAFCRYVLFLFSATIIVGLLTPLFRKDRKSLHDMICSTVEIRTKNEK